MAKVRKGITFKATHQFLSALFSEDVHAKRVYSLANATLGVITSASLAVNTIGQGLALARGRLTAKMPCRGGIQGSAKDRDQWY